MALYRCGSGGATPTETVLWTNPSPTAANFGKQSVTLSDDINNYDYIAVEYNYSKSSTIDTEKSKSIMSVEDFKKSGQSSVPRNSMAIGIINASNAGHTREVMYITDTSVQFSACYIMNGSTQANSNAVPLQIIGIKL
jgi:hypothetical protein